MTEAPHSLPLEERIKGVMRDRQSDLEIALARQASLRERLRELCLLRRDVSGHIKRIRLAIKVAERKETTAKSAKGLGA